MATDERAARFLDAVAVVVARRREELGLSQAQLARRAELTRHTVVNVENRKGCNLTTLWQIIGALGWSGREFGLAAEAEMACT